MKDDFQIIGNEEEELLLEEESIFESEEELEKLKTEIVYNPSQFDLKTISIELINRLIESRK